MGTACGLSHLAPLVTTIGLISDVIGAFFVASEVVQQYPGRRHQTGGTNMWGSKPVEETPEFADWQHKTHGRMKLGLVFLVIGFVLQIAGTWASALASR